MVVPNPVHPFVTNAHFREWGWADEQGGQQHIKIPYAFTRSWVTGVRVIARGAYSNVGYANALYLPIIDKANPYRIYYARLTGGDWRTNGEICLAYSPNGTNFTNYAGNPLIGIGSYPAGCQSVLGPAVFYDAYDRDPTRRWKMVFQGYHTVDAVWYMYVYKSADGLSWSYWLRPANQPDSRRTTGGGFYPYALKVGNAVFVMYWDTALAGRLSIYDSLFNNIYNHGVILTAGGAGAWDEGAVQPASLYYNTGIFYCVYGGRNAALEWAMGLSLSGGSRPGFDYTKYPLNPLTEYYPGTSCGVLKPSIIMVSNDFVMYSEFRTVVGAGLEIYKFTIH